ncbi:MAG: DUF4097 domain-containing protein [Elusimicrobiota bacterium]|jgi:DUF4097 and DUF4098 domain-containing protein YvlB|nr:DUF4097 domain-containing protein [Elusimicrobiota bacterium]
MLKLLKKICLPLFLLCPFFVVSLAVAAYANDLSREFQNNSFSDIFITTKKADLTVIMSTNTATSTLTWKNKNCAVDIKKLSEDVINISVEPKAQYVFLKQILGIPRPACKLQLMLGENKTLYASSETGDIRFFDASLEAVKVYTTQGTVEISNYTGNLSAETLTGEISVKNSNCNNLALKTASGQIDINGNAAQANILNTSGTTKLQGNIDDLHFYSSTGNFTAHRQNIPTGKINLLARSSSGDIKIIFPKGTDLTGSNIEIKSTYGYGVLQYN